MTQKGKKRKGKAGERMSKRGKGRNRGRNNGSQSAQSKRHMSMMEAVVKYRQQDSHQGRLSGGTGS